MATLSGEYLLDASGNRLLDASSNVVTQDGIQVAVMDNGILVNAAVTGGGSLWGTLIAWLLENVGPMVAAEIAEHIFGGGTELDLNDYLPDIRTNAQRLIPQYGTAAQYLEQIDGKADQILGNFPITVEFPETPPGWYTAPTEIDYDQIAGDVWGYTLAMTDMKGVDSGPMAQTVLVNAAMSLQFRDGYEGILLPDNQHFRFIATDSWYTALWLGDWTATNLNALVPQLDLSLVEDGDTLWSYLNREYGSYDWLRTAPNSHDQGGRVYIEQTPTNAYFVCTLTDADIQACWPVTIPEQPPVEVTVNAAPVWPGSANVTLGTPVALTNGMTITDEMDGVIVAVTTPPTRTGLYVIGSESYDYGVGRIAFESDGGELEPWQYLGFRAALFTPKSMRRASKVHLQVLGGAEGTVTPWITSE